MGHDASELLGSPQRAGVTVESVGYARAQAARAGVVANNAALGGALGADLVDPHGERAQTPSFGAGFLAVTDTELALIGLRSTATRLVLGSPRARVPRSSVTSARLQGRFPVGLLAIDFRDGTSWQVEVAAIHTRAAKKLAAALGTPASA